MKNLSLGKQFFDELIRQNNIYVDKTEIIYRLLHYSQSNAFYFLSRPRRFGKSLLVSTLNHIFQGNRILFKGLWLEDQLDWENYNFPVILIDFNNVDYVTADLEKSLAAYLDKIAEQFELKLLQQTAKSKLMELIEQLYLKTGKSPVVLVDEYDKPLIDFLAKKHQETKLEYHKEILKSFYSTFKSQVSIHLKFVLITGVARVGKLSIFSDLNHLVDLTFHEDFADLLGYTQSELEYYFQEYLRQLADHQQTDLETCKEAIKHWYNGYSWDGKHFVYNPFSILQLFFQHEFSNYWYETGTPSFLIEELKRSKITVLDLENYHTRQSLKESSDVNNLNVIALLFQTGYLTIKQKEIHQLVAKYTLGYPNEEVRQSLQQHQLSGYLGDQGDNLKTLLLDKMELALQNRDIEEFIDIFKTIFSMIPYNLFLKPEAYYHTVVYLVLNLLGFDVKAEIQTSKGRLDAIIIYQNDIYVIEFKRGSLAEALNQIHRQQYYLKFAHQQKNIFLLAISLDDQQRNIGEWKLEPWHPKN